MAHRFLPLRLFAGFLLILGLSSLLSLVGCDSSTLSPSPSPSSSLSPPPSPSPFPSPSPSPSPSLSPSPPSTKVEGIFSTPRRFVVFVDNSTSLRPGSSTGKGCGWTEQQWKEYQKTVKHTLESLRRAHELGLVAEVQVWLLERGGKITVSANRMYREDAFIEEHLTPGTLVDVSGTRALEAVVKKFQGEFEGDDARLLLFSDGLAAEGEFSPDLAKDLKELPWRGMVWVEDCPGATDKDKQFWQDVGKGHLVSAPTDLFLLFLGSEMLPSFVGVPQGVLITNQESLFGLREYFKDVEGFHWSSDGTPASGFEEGRPWWGRLSNPREPKEFFWDYSDDNPPVPLPLYSIEEKGESRLPRLNVPPIYLSTLLPQTYPWHPALLLEFPSSLTIGEESLWPSEDCPFFRVEDGQRSRVFELCPLPFQGEATALQEAVRRLLQQPWPVDWGLSFGDLQVTTSLIWVPNFSLPEGQNQGSWYTLLFQKHWLVGQGRRKVTFQISLLPSEMIVVKHETHLAYILEGVQRPMEQDFVPRLSHQDLTANSPWAFLVFTEKAPRTWGDLDGFRKHTCQANDPVFLCENFQGRAPYLLRLPTVPDKTTEIWQQTWEDWQKQEEKTFWLAFPFSGWTRDEPPPWEGPQEGDSRQGSSLDCSLDQEVRMVMVWYRCFSDQGNRFLCKMQPKTVPWHYDEGQDKDFLCGRENLGPGGE